MLLRRFLRGHREQGFTLLEVMIAVAIFSFLMIYIAQIMRLEIRTYNTASRQSALEQNGRTAMMHILDEIRLHPATFYFPGDINGKDSGIYYRLRVDPNNPNLSDITSNLIDLNPSNIENLPVGTGIYFDRPKLWFRDTQNANANYLIADNIDSLTMTLDPNNEHLIKITIVAKDPVLNESYPLVTWARLY